MIYLKKAIGIYYQDDQIEIDVVGRTLMEKQHIGNLKLTEISQKDPIMVKSEVENFLSDLNVSPEIVYVALSPDQVSYKHLTLPVEVEENLDQAIRLQLLNILPEETEEYSVEKVVRKTPDGNTFKIDVFVISHERIREILDFIKSIGLDPDVLTMTCFGFEKFLTHEKTFRDKPVFIADLGTSDFSVYLFREGHFSAFRRREFDPESIPFPELFREIETCASNQRLSDDDEIECILNLSDSSWTEKYSEEAIPFVQPISKYSLYDDYSVEDLKSCSTATLALNHRKKTFNLIPPKWRKKSSAFTIIPTVVLAVLAGLLVIANLSRGYIQEDNYINFLEENIARHQKKHQEVLRLRRNINRIQKEIETYQQILKKPVSDLAILSELTEQASEKTYLQQYIRSDKLDISGYTDSYQDLVQRFESIADIKNLTQRGSITKKGNLENFHFIINLEE